MRFDKSTQSKRFFVAVSMTVISFVTANPCEAISIRHDVSSAEYSALAAEYPTVGYIGDSFLSQFFCTGTLIAPDKVITAAHCIDEDSDGEEDFPADEMTFGLEATVPFTFASNVSSAIVHPQWVSSGGDASFDVSILTLVSPVTTVTPSRLYFGNPLGQLGTMIGYGDQGTGTQFTKNLPGTSDKLAAQNIIDTFGISDGSADFLVETDFDSPSSNKSTTGSSSPIGLEGTTGPGDSGGPIFIHVESKDVVVGILNGGLNLVGADSEYGDVSSWAAVGSASNMSFLITQGITPYIPGDYNANGTVGQEDYDLWDADFGSTNNLDADGNGNGIVDAADYVFWRDRYTPPVSVSIPEPSAFIIMLLACLPLTRRLRTR